jgi:hypothetical protein
MQTRVYAVTPLEECAARLAKDIDFLMLDRAGQEEDAAAMLSLFELAESPDELLAMIPGAAPGPQRSPPAIIDPFADDDEPETVAEAPGAAGWLQRFKDATTWTNADLGDLLGYKVSTIQAYTTGRLAERFDRAQREKLAGLCRTIAASLAILAEEV